jgi:hypothetical protein
MSRSTLSGRPSNRFFVLGQAFSAAAEVEIYVGVELLREMLRQRLPHELRGQRADRPFCDQHLFVLIRWRARLIKAMALL